jgi:hypothetical protein
LAGFRECCLLKRVGEWMLLKARMRMMGMVVEMMEVREDGRGH